MLLFFTINKQCDNAICEIANGNADALSVVYHAYGRLIYSIGYQIVNNTSDADDVFQDVMLKIIKQAHTYRSGTNPKAWILSITRTCAIDVVKKRTKDVRLDDIELSLSDSCNNIDDMLMLRSAMQKIDDSERTIIALKLYAGLSHREIASVMGINLFSAQKKYQRALAKLKKYYEE